ncbi:MULTISPECIES: hypothetical protein [unclassified Streptomyces]|uniref:hypothetical protein n=1 Tax=unclassified Streptomyces TaxID=2593676 RepID=UPI0038085AB1
MLADQVHTALAFALTGSGRLLEAHAATVRAVELYEDVTARDPAAHTAGLAMALDNLCAASNRLDRLREAVEAGGRAVDVRRRLASADPGTQPLIGCSALRAGVCAAACG